MASGNAFSSQAGIDAISAIENVIGSQGNGVLTGNGDDNVLIGQAGSDTLDGAGGNDRLAGRAGIDTPIGGGGNDTRLGGLGDDSPYTIRMDASGQCSSQRSHFGYLSRPIGNSPLTVGAWRSCAGFYHTFIKRQD